MRAKKKEETFNFLNTKQKCPYFFPYNPSYSPSEHQQLQREARNQRLLMIGMLLAALIGAAGYPLTTLLRTLVIAKNLQFF